MWSANINIQLGKRPKKEKGNISVRCHQKLKKIPDSEAAKSSVIVGFTAFLWLESDWTYQKNHKQTLQNVEPLLPTSKLTYFAALREFLCHFTICAVPAGLLGSSPAMTMLQFHKFVLWKAHVKYLWWAVTIIWYRWAECDFQFGEINLKKTLSFWLDR